MNRKFAAVLALAFAASGLFACSSAPAPVASADPVIQVGVQPYVAASSGCADRTDWCPAPTTIKLDAFRITVGNGWLSRYVTDWDTDLAKPSGYDTISLTEEVALVTANPGVGVADLLRGLVIPGATDLKFEPAPLARRSASRPPPSRSSAKADAPTTKPSWSRGTMPSSLWAPPPIRPSTLASTWGMLSRSC